jgi:cardiolipin synthase
MTAHEKTDNSTIAEPTLYATPAEWFDALHADILNAKKLIYIEIYRLNIDAVGHRIIEALSQKCKEGLDVKILVDSWGTKDENGFFEPITSNKGQVRFFDKIKMSIDYFSKNHQRNHRKIVVIDNHILHFGSANITEYSSHWRESILRIEDPIALTFKKILLENWKNASLEFYKKRKYLRTIKVGGYTIVRDVPSIYNQKIKTQFEKEIKKAKKSVVIITPYFLPGYKLRRLLILASRRKVEISIYVPSHSDVRLVDQLRDKYLGGLHLNKIKIHYFQPTNLHAKLMLIDNETFIIGSSNFDYRSFRYMHEITLSGNNPAISNLVKDYIIKLQPDCLDFDYNLWKNRSRISKIVGWLLIPLRHLL